jgi:hypothetical protein
MGLLEVRGFGVGCEEHSKAGSDYTSLNLVSISEHFLRWPQKQVAKIVKCGQPDRTRGADGLRGPSVRTGASI